MKILMTAFFLIAVTAGVVRGQGVADEYEIVLKQHVDENGLVDYAAIKESPARLEAFAAALARLPRATYDEWNDESKIAFWINAYNALTLKLIVDHYPIQPSTLKKLIYPANSIRHIPGAWDTVTFEVMGEKMTLDHIEHGILRKEFDEPRIHMALVCAAVSCPPLRREPYRGEELGDQLDDQTRRFLSNPERLAIDRDAGVVRLSAIFDWFAADFVRQYGNEGGRSDQDAVINFVGRYVGDDDRLYLEKGGYDVKHFDYDWTLNERTQ